MRNKLKLMLILFILIFTVSSFSSAASSNDSISLDEARDVAYRFIVSNMVAQNEAGKEGWEQGIELGETITLYGADDTISAYLFNIADSEGNCKGYIVIGANTNYAPIVEYSYDQEPFLYKAVNEADSLKKSLSKNANSKHKFYYTGALDYFVEIEDENNQKSVYYISSDNILEAEKETVMLRNENQDTISAYKEAWDSIMAVSGSKPPSSGGIYITDPFDYEDGYQTYTFDEVTGYNLTYKTTSHFSGYSDHCGPTAGINLALYWNSRGYTELYDKNSWQTAFSKLYTYMKTAQNSGTLPSDFGYGISKYFYGDCSVLTAYSTDTRVSASDIKDSISRNRPFGLAVYGHQLYKNHMVLGLGWEEFKYSTGYISLYVRIADGWSSSPTRFVHHTVGLSSMVMCHAYPQ